MNRDFIALGTYLPWGGEGGGGGRVMVEGGKGMRVGGESRERAWGRV